VDSPDAKKLFAAIIKVKFEGRRGRKGVVKEIDFSVCVVDRLSLDKKV